MTKVRAAMLGGLEVRVVKDDEKTHTMMIQHSYVLSHVAQFAMELFRHELVAVEPMPVGAPVVGFDPSFQPYQRTTIELSVKRACDGAEALFAEMNKRRWLVASPPLSEIVEPRDAGVSFGLHGRAAE